jgi:methyltransferase-like protein
MVDFIKERMVPKHDAYLLHDTLAEINEPVYFFQFAAHVANHGLRYLADAQFHVMLATNLPPDLADILQRYANNTVELEQYLDFLRNRPFRQSLLCHQQVQLSARLKPERLADFYVASPILPAQQDEPATAAEKFNAPNGAAFTTDHPVTKAALHYLSEIWPRAVSFNALLVEAQKRTGLDSQSLDPKEAQLLGFNLLQAYAYNDELIELHIHQPLLAVESGEYPTASPVARWQTQFGQRVTNLRHEQINLDNTSHQLLPYLDGSHDRPALLAILEEWVAEDRLEIEKKDGQRVTDAAALRQILTGLLDIKLRELGRAALMIG